MTGKGRKRVLVAAVAFLAVAAAVVLWPRPPREFDFLYDLHPRSVIDMAPRTLAPGPSRWFVFDARRAPTIAPALKRHGWVEQGVLGREGGLEETPWNKGWDCVFVVKALAHQNEEHGMPELTPGELFVGTDREETWWDHQLRAGKRFFHLSP